MRRNSKKKKKKSHRKRTKQRRQNVEGGEEGKEGRPEGTERKQYDDPLKDLRSELQKEKEEKQNFFEEIRTVVLPEDSEFLDSLANLTKVVLISDRHGKVQKELFTERQKLIVAGGNNSLDAAMVATYSYFLNVTRERLSKKFHELKRKQLLMHSLALKCRDPKIYQRRKRDVDKTTKIMDNIQADAKVLNEHVSELKSSRIFRVFIELLHESRILVPEYLRPDEDLDNLPSFEDVVRAEKEAQARKRDQKEGPKPPQESGPSVEELILRLKADKKEVKEQDEDAGSENSEESMPGFEELLKRLQ